MDQQTYDRGREIRAAVLGEAYVAQAATGDDFSTPFQDLVTEYCWGAVWGRDGLSRKTRSMLNLAMIAVLNRPNELRTHVKGALTNGVTREEIREVFMQVAIYAGVPAAVDSFRIAREAFAEYEQLMIGFIGLGNMGFPMAGRLAAAGRDLVVYDTRGDVIDRATKFGAHAASSPQQVADRAEIVLASLPSVQASSAVAESVAGGAKIKLFIDLSTVGTTAAQHNHATLQAGGVAALDAPVSGGVGGRHRAAWPSWSPGRAPRSTPPRCCWKSSAVRSSSTRNPAPPRR